MDTERWDRKQSDGGSPGSFRSENRGTPSIGPIVLGLDIGHSKCCVACGEADPREFLSLTGIAERRFDPNMRLSVPHPHWITSALHELVIELEKRYEIFLRAAEVAISGKHIEGKTFAEGDEVSIPATHESLHRFHRSDDEKPWWDFTTGHAIHGSRVALQEVVKAVGQVPLDTRSLVFSGLASAYAVTRPQERWDGAAAVLTIDIGAGTTDYLLFRDGSIAASGVVSAGGDMITTEIALERKIPWPRAEEEKIKSGSDSPQREIIVRHITELLCDVAEKVRIKQRRSPVVYLTGGVSRIRNIEEIGAAVFGGPVYRASATNISGLNEPPPECSTVLGLLKFGYNRGRRAAREAA